MYSVLKDKNQGEGFSTLTNQKLDLLVGGNFVCNAFLQFEHYPSITGLVSFGPSCAMNYKINERNSMFVTRCIFLLNPKLPVGHGRGTCF